MSHELSTDFRLSVEYYDADFRNSYLMKIGEVYKAVLTIGEKRVYKFILDEDSDLILSQTVSNEGLVKSQLKMS